MKSQQLSNRGPTQLRFNNQCVNAQKKALKPNNLMFSRNRSLSIQSNKYDSSAYDKMDIFYDRNFVPKLKSKQMICEPKFFFSLQRKKIKIQNSSPSFGQIKLQNPQMKGYKLKKKSIFGNESQLRQKQLIDQRQRKRKMSVFSRSYTQHSNERLKGKDVQFRQKVYRNLSSISSTYNKTQFKKSKRPNIYQNISFLIRRRKQIKNRASLNRISNSRHYMREAIAK